MSALWYLYLERARVSKLTRCLIVDLKAAFDREPHAEQRRVLKNLELPPGVRDHDAAEDAAPRTHFHVGTLDGEVVDLLMGVRQGCMLSLILEACGAGLKVLGNSEKENFSSV